MINIEVAEREGFEPPIQLPVCRISSAVLSTTQPPLQQGRGTRLKQSGGEIAGGGGAYKARAR